MGSSRERGAYVQQVYLLPATMPLHTYTKFNPALADAVDLQALLDQLSDFLLQSDFAGSPDQNPWWAEPSEGSDRSMDALKETLHRCAA
jgi:Ca-activated chloride channel family protein